MAVKQVARPNEGTADTKVSCILSLPDIQEIIAAAPDILVIGTEPA